MKSIPRTVVILGLVSLFTDCSSEMIYPLLPVFLSKTLGAGALALGWIEGVAEATAAVLKILSGKWTDRFRVRKPLILIGYGLAGFVRPLIAFAHAWPFVLVLRFIDRAGKGIRSSPRDALIADVTDPAQRGSAYGFHRAMDHAGAVAGPLIAGALLSFFGVSLRNIFLFAAIPAIVAFLILALGVKEKLGMPSEPIPSENLNNNHFGPHFKYFLFALLIFTLGNSTDAFLIMRLSDAGISAGWIATLWSLHHIVKMTATFFGGKFSDRIGHRQMIVSGWIFFAFIYLAFALVHSPTELVTVFLAYGLYYGLVEPAERALVANLAPLHLRGTAFGYYHLIIGLGALPANLIFGWLWQKWGAQTAFFTGAGLAGGACIIMLALVSDLTAPSNRDTQ